MIAASVQSDVDGIPKVSCLEPFHKTAAARRHGDVPSEVRIVFGLIRLTARGSDDSVQPVIHPYPGQSLSLFLEIANLDQRGPQLDRSLDDACYIVEDSEQVVLEEIRLKRVKRFVKIRRA